MTHSYGYRRKTRSKFKKSFKTAGQLKLSRFMTIYKRGDYVDVVTDSAQQKGMPYKDYHGQTGQVFDVNKNSVGVIFQKMVNGRYIEKRIKLRIDHVRKSQGREAWKKMIQENDIKKKQAKAEGKKLVLKRLPEGPKEEYVFKGEIQFQNPRVFREDF